MKASATLERYYVLPCCLLLLNLCNEIISYKAKLIHDDFLRTLLIMAMVLFGASLVAFALTLRHGPSMIERFARLVEPVMDEAAIAYTRKVTLVWCAFFALNGLASLYTALYASLALWTLYNGLLAYLLMGLLFAVEYAVRQRVKKQKPPLP